MNKRMFQVKNTGRLRNMFFIALLLSAAIAGIVTTAPVYAKGNGHGGNGNGDGNGNGGGNGHGTATFTTSTGDDSGNGHDHGNPHIITTMTGNTGAITATSNLVSLVNGMQLSQGTATSLDAKLNAAQAALVRGDTTAAKNMLNAFINEVNAQCCNANGKPLTTQQANQLTTAAQQIIQSM